MPSIAKAAHKGMDEEQEPLAMEGEGRGGAIRSDRRSKRRDLFLKHSMLQTP